MKNMKSVEMTQSYLLYAPQSASESNSIYSKSDLKWIHMKMSNCCSHTVLKQISWKATTCWPDIININRIWTNMGHHLATNQASTRAPDKIQPPFWMDLCFVSIWCFPKCAQTIIPLRTMVCVIDFQQRHGFPKKNKLWVVKSTDLSPACQKPNTCIPRPYTHIHI